ncbi:MAG: hypothetical protein LQ348_002658 [Seirophora lacunosa]|nr:MAG: hypothetical protein LQ348_002658 [Seirophora lacunosa]
MSAKQLCWKNDMEASSVWQSTPVACSGVSPTSKDDWIGVEAYSVADTFDARGVYLAPTVKSNAYQSAATAATIASGSDTTIYCPRRTLYREPLRIVVFVCNGFCRTVSAEFARRRLYEQVMQRLQEQIIAANTVCSARKLDTLSLPGLTRITSPHKVFGLNIHSRRTKKGG